MPNVSEVMNIIGDIKDKNVIMTDDIIDTAGTITNGAQALMDRGAKAVYACCTHPVLSGPAIRAAGGFSDQRTGRYQHYPSGRQNVQQIAGIVRSALSRRSDPSDPSGRFCEQAFQLSKG